jgi:hypothetical protein
LLYLKTQKVYIFVSTVFSHTMDEQQTVMYNRTASLYSSCTGSTENVLPILRACLLRRSRDGWAIA